MDNFPLLSVIVPVYKVENYLDRCVKSVISQTYTDLEIILVDDGSPDNCPAQCDAWAEKDSRIQVIHKQNGGLSDARNAGISIATGEFIAFVDSDDWLNVNMYSVLINTIQKTGSDAAGCSFIRTDGKTIPARTNNDPEIKVFDNNEIMSELIGDRVIKQVVWNKVYRADKIQNILFEVGKYHEDEFWAYLALSECEKYAAVDYPGYYYFQRADSIMGEGYSLKRLDAIEAKLRRVEFCKTNYPQLAAKAKINVLFSSLYHCQLALMHLSGEEKQKAVDFLTAAVRTCDLQKTDFSGLSEKQKAFAVSANKNLVLTAKMRNTLKIGL